MAGQRRGRVCVSRVGVVLDTSRRYSSKEGRMFDNLQNALDELNENRRALLVRGVAARRLQRAAARRKLVAKRDPLLVNQTPDPFCSAGTKSKWN